MFSLCSTFSLCPLKPISKLSDTCQHLSDTCQHVFWNHQPDINLFFGLSLIQFLKIAKFFKYKCRIIQIVNRKGLILKIWSTSAPFPFKTWRQWTALGNLWTLLSSYSIINSLNMIKCCTCIFNYRHIYFSLNALRNFLLQNLWDSNFEC